MAALPTPDAVEAPVSPTPAGTMHPRFVAACQQLLALAVVATVLTPAAGVMTLDVRPPGQLAAVAATSGDASLVPTAPVPAKVREYPLTAAAHARPGRALLRATTRRHAGADRVVSDPLPASGYTTVGITWDPDRAVADDRIAMAVRSRTAGGWSGWTALDYHAEHGPDPGSAEAARSRPGSEPVLVGEADRVQVRVDARDGAPADLRLAVVGSGRASATARQRPAIVIDDAPAPATTRARAVAAAPKPNIYSRKQWGADERLRDGASLHYGTINAGFVHHTVNANGYSRDQVPAILRGIYAYHTRSRGWSDIGYNFLVDRFGRIWEGRAGGVHRPVVGAHTLGYNDEAFAMSAIGNFETARPSAAMLTAYAELFAWKLGLHGIGAGDGRQHVVDRDFKAINGHRDAGSTACPGRYLYAQLGTIRTRAAGLQKGWRGRELESNLAGSALPDLVMRRQSDDRVMIVPLETTAEGIRAGKPIATDLTLPTTRNLWKAGDWDRDGHGDLLTRRRNDARLYLYRGDGTGRFADPVVIGTGFDGHGLLAPVGDFTGDGRPDLVGQPGGGAMRVYPGKTMNGLQGDYRIGGTIAGSRIIPIGRWNAGGAPDILVRTQDALYAYLGNGPGGLTRRSKVAIDVNRYNWLVGVSDVRLTGHADIVAREKSTDRLVLIQARNDGTLSAPVSLGRILTGYDLPG